jgi:hypothetical protein
MKSTQTGNERYTATVPPTAINTKSLCHGTIYSRMNYQALETIDVKQEQEFWNEVVDRTTQ